MDGLTKLLNIGQVTDTRETSRRDDGWTNKVAKYRTSDRCTKRQRNRDL